MKNKSAIIFLSLLLLLVFCALFLYKNRGIFSTSIQISNDFPFIGSKQKKYDFSDAEVIIINNSNLVNVTIKDKQKLEQIVRRYPSLFNDPYEALRIIISSDTQDFSFSWESGTPFSHSVDLFTIPYLDITLHIDPKVLINANWDKEAVERETEGVLIYALERAVMNLDPETATTYSEAEESTKSEEIESNAQESINQLNTDNSNLLFNVVYE